MGGSRDLFGVQILRGIAASAVVVHHTLEESLGAHVGSRSPDWLITSGASGVDIFFVISGFIMLYVSFPPARTPLAPGTFLRKRVLRIFPLYWTVCLVMLGLGVVGFMSSKSFGTDTVLKSLLLIPDSDALIGVSWTLSYEIYFYAIFASTLMFGSRGTSVLATSLAIVILMMLGPLMPAGDIGRFVSDPIALEFCFGLFLAWDFEARGEWAPISFVWFPIAFSALAAAPALVPHDTTGGLSSPVRVIAWGLPAVFVLASFLSLKESRRRGMQFAALLGDASYSIYLTHIFVMIAYAKLLKSTGLAEVSQPPVILLVIVTAVAVGLLTHLSIERPLQALVRSPASRRIDRPATLPEEAR